MKAKEKAEMLVWKYSRALQIWDQENSLKAIQCALIAVDEILNAIEYLDEDSEYYWEEVKKQIEKL